MAIQPDVTTALDETGRRYAFRPAAILGNGSLLATFSERGEIERLFWPNVDHGQHLGELRLGLDRDGETHWLDEAPCSWTQSYESGASVLRTTADLQGTTIEVIDLVTPAEPVLVRGIRSSSAERLVVHIAPSLDGDERSGAGYVDPGSGALVFYLRDVALAVALVAADTTSTLRESNGREPSHDVVVYRAPVDGLVAGGLVEEARVLVAFGATPDEAIARLRRPAAVTLDVLVAERTAYDREAIALARPPSGDACRGRPLRALSPRSRAADGPQDGRDDRGTRVRPELRAVGRLRLRVASRPRVCRPQLPRRRARRSRRPRAAVAGARAGTGGPLAAALLDRRLARAELGPSPARRDGDGRVRVRGRVAGARRCGARSRALAVGACCGGLPLHVHGRRDGSSAARASISGSRRTGSTPTALPRRTAASSPRAAMATRHEPTLAERYRSAAERVRAAIDEHLWSDEHGRYLRSRWVGRSDELGEAPPAAFDRPLRYPTKAVRSVDREDARVDSSLLGLAWPFRAVDPASPRMRATLEAVERELRLEDGGVLRHQDDDYAGGNPWLISTLWLGLAERQAGDDAGHRASLAYALARQTPLGLLPEQVTRDGEPAWAVPLGWSHAMLILAARPELALVRDGTPN